MRGLYLSLIGCAAVLAVACGGSQPPAETPEPPAPASEPPAASAPAASATPSEADEEAPGAKEDNADDGAGSSDKGDKPKKAAVPEPKFTEGMTVDQAIDAVPQGMARENVDQDELSKPLHRLQGLRALQAPPERSLQAQGRHLERQGRRRRRDHHAQERKARVVHRQADQGARLEGPRRVAEHDRVLVLDRARCRLSGTVSSLRARPGRTPGPGPARRAPAPRCGRNDALSASSLQWSRAASAA